jgi:hypothetical protein
MAPVPAASTASPRLDLGRERSLLVGPSQRDGDVLAVETGVVQSPDRPFRLVTRLEEADHAAVRLLHLVCLLANRAAGSMPPAVGERCGPRGARPVGWHQSCYQP